MDRLTGIQIFARVVEVGSFSRAASDLGLGQPTVTKHIASLEKTLGARLLNRNTRGVSVTEMGGLYYERCKSVLRELEEADAVLEAESDGLRGVLRLNTSVAFGRRVMAPLLIEFIQIHPDLSIDLSCEDIYVNLIAQGVDVAIRLGKLADSSLGGRYLGVNPWIMVASPEYLAEHGAPNDPQELGERPCLIYSSVQGDDVWHLRSPLGAMNSIRVKGRLRSNNLSTILAAARANLGVAILPHYVASSSIQAGRLAQVLPSYSLQEQEIHAVFPSPKLAPRKVLAFIGFLQARFRDEWWSTIS